MSSEKQYYINGQWLTYEQAHNELGYTLTRPQILTFYTEDLIPVQVRKDISDNTLYDTVHKTWVTDIDDLNLYNKVGTVTLYKSEVPTTYDAYSNTLLSDIPYFISYNDDITSISYVYANEGFTPYPCQDYTVESGEIITWYDENLDLYWDTKTGQWLDSPPLIEYPQNDVFIRRSTESFNLLPTWEDDLLQLPTRYRSTSWDAQDNYFNSQRPLLTGYYLTYTSDFTDFDPDVEFYTDTTRLNITLYVAPEDGADDYQGNHHAQGDSFTGDYKKVWVDAEEVTVYKGSIAYTFGLTSDINHPVLYYDGSEFLTPTDLHNAGYTLIPSSIVLCSDTNVEFDIDNVYEVIYNNQYGYYINNQWYSTVQDLNSAGYYLVEKVSKVVYISSLNPGGSWPYDYGVVNTTTSFRSYRKEYYEDAEKTTPLLWDGHNWFCDTLAQYNDPHLWRNKLRDMPSSTTSEYIRLLTMVTASGNPITPFIQSEINTQMYLHLATSYGSTVYTDCKIVETLIIAYWKLI